MTAYIKIFFSALLLVGGFGLASLFGPPKLADQFADVLRPASSQPNWGSLQPLDADLLTDPAWDRYASAALAEPPVGKNPAAPSPLVIATAAESMPNGPTETPAWMTNGPPPTAASFHDDYAVAPAAWRDSTAPVGWPARPSTSATKPSPKATPLIPSQPSWDANLAAPSQPANAGSWFTPSVSPQSSTPPPALAPTAPAENFRPAVTPRNEAWPSVSQTPVTPLPNEELTPVAPFAARTHLVSTPSATADQPGAPSQGTIRHVVTDGDTLARLAKRYLNDPFRAGDIFIANQQTLSHPDLLPIGAELVIPTAATPPSVASAANLAPSTVERKPFARLLGPQPAQHDRGFVGR